MPAPDAQWSLLLWFWVSIGLLSLIQLPPPHTSWSRGARAVMYLFMIGVCAVLGPLGFWWVAQFGREEDR